MSRVDGADPRRPERSRAGRTGGPVSPPPEPSGWTERADPQPLGFRSARPDPFCGSPACDPTNRAPPLHNGRARVRVGAYPRPQVSANASPLGLAPTRAYPVHQPGNAEVSQLSRV